MSIRYILDPAHIDQLNAWGQRSTLFAFDFDGTLAPIVDDPKRACMSNQGWFALRSLASAGTVAVISGRERDALSRLVPPEVSYLVGNHGNEGLPEGDPDVAEKARICLDWHEHLIDDQRLWKEAEGAMMEDKGLSLSLHYRNAINPSLARSKLLARVAMLDPKPFIIRGNNVINLLPAQALTKKHALAAIMRHCGCGHAIFVGDDLTDELVFQDAPSNWLTIRVGDCMYSEARYRLRNVDEVVTFMTQLHRLIQAESNRPTLASA